MNRQQQQLFQKTRRTFYLGQGDTVGADYIYDQTYKNVKAKQKFQKDPKYNYFNAVMQMKRKIAIKEQVYKKIFQADSNQKPQKPQNQKNNSFLFSKTSNSFIEPECQIVKVQKLKKNSFKMVKQRSFIDPIIGLTKQNTEIKTLNKIPSISQRSGHRSNLSLYDKHSPKVLSFEMTSKARNNRSYIQFEVKEKPIEVHANQSFYQPSNPKPRLEQIINQYRKINKHSHQPKVKKLSLPKDFVERLAQTSKRFYPGLNKKRTSLF